MTTRITSAPADRGPHDGAAWLGPLHREGAAELDGTLAHRGDADPGALHRREA
jgi:hypothetical protein